MDEARQERQGDREFAGPERRDGDRRHQERRHDPTKGGRRDGDRRRSSRRAKILSVGALAGFAFTLGARQFGSKLTAPSHYDTMESGEGGDSSIVETAEGDFRVPAFTREMLEPIIQEAAAMYGLKPDLIRAVIQTESRFDPTARSRVGAQGLMQLMPRTAQHLGVEDPMDPRQNVLGGTKYLGMMLERFNGNTAKALAAYNAGPTVVARHRGVPPYRETQGYVRKIAKLVEDTDAEFTVPAVRRASLRRGTRHARVSRASSRNTRKATVRKASSRSARKAAVSKRTAARTTTARRASSSSRRAPVRKATVRRASNRRGD
jgi:transglycosylase-like protein with SLT domain